MHGREGEERKRRRHMWPVPALGTTTVASDSITSTVDSFCKDGRRISVGDCALFKPPKESPPFIGIIRSLTTGKEDNLKLGVNWLYRPAEVKLAKGILLEAAPNEVFYSFHKDEIPAASLLHPCKVAFLRKGVELPSGLSSFVCRRVYDIANKCLWWLTDQDYVNERQEEVDQLLDKTRQEMQAAVQSGGRSPKPLNGPSSTSQLKPGSDSVQNSASSFPSQVKGRKRGERGDPGSEPIKRERSLRADDGDSGHFRSENMLKSEIAKITEKGGLVDFEGVEKFIQLMQPDRGEKKMDLAGRIMLADVIAATDRFDCLGRFVHLRGLPVLDEWLQEVHKGKIGDSTSPKESDKTVEEFLLALLRALDKLPVNLHALQACQIGKSVNNLRSHKNLEIQKKARSLVDTWKKRVEAEMNINDAKSGSSQAVSWPSKPGFSEVSHGGNRRTGGSAEVAMKSSIVQPSASKTVPVKLGHGDSVKSASASPGSVKMSTPLSASMSVSSKDVHCKMGVGGGTSDLPPTTAREEKSSSSSQSQNNSQSCSSDHAKTLGSSSKEDARSSTAGSMSVNKTSGSASRHRKSSNGFTGASVSGVQKETTLGKCSSLNRNANSEKVSQPAITSERAHDMPSVVDHGNSHRLIVRFPNPGRSPARSASGGSFDDPSVMVSRASSPGLSEKHDNYDRKVKGKNDALRANNVTDVNTESWQSNDMKDGLVASDEGDGSPAAVPDEECCRNSDETGKTMEASKVTCSSSGNDQKSGKLFDGSFSSINALIESCAKYSEASATMSAGDDVGMNLLASVAAGEMSKSDLGSPIGSPGSSSPVADDYVGNSGKMRVSREDVGALNQGHPDDSTDGDTEKHGGRKMTSALLEEKPTVERNEQFHSSSVALQQIADSCLKSDGGLDETMAAASLDLSTAEAMEDTKECEGANQLNDKKVGLVGTDAGPDMKSKAKNPLDEKKSDNHADEEIADSSSMPTASDLVRNSVGVLCGPDNTVSVVKAKKETVDESSECPASEMDGENKNLVHEVLNAGISTEQKLLPVDANCMEATGERSNDAVLPCSGKVLGPENIDEVKAESSMEVKSLVEKNENQRKEDASNVPPPPLDDQITGVSSVGLDQKNEKAEEHSQDKNVLNGSLAPHGEPPTIPVQETGQGVKSTGDEADDMEERTSAAEASSLSVAGGSDLAMKLDFDLNEGFPVDEGHQGEPVASAVHLPSPLPFQVSSMSTGLPASITVASALKGPFVPPENLMRSKGELGWKGSAATSAFRPAEPRKVLEMPLGTADISPDATASKQSRPPLDIDLNVADERVLEDIAPQSSAHETGSESGMVNSRDLGRGEMFSSTPSRNAGLDLDLNRVDEGIDIGQFSASTSRRVEVPLLSVRSSSSSGHSNSEVNVLRDFDLNNGPGLDEMGTELAPRNQHAKSSVPFLPPVAGLRMNNTELGNLSSWFPPVNSYSAVTIPSILPDRGEQPYPIVATSGAQRILGPPTGGTTYGPDVYRGPVLSSSPAVAFPSAASYPYPGFPFGTSFPLPSTSFSCGSTAYVDSSPSGGICFPSQFPAGAVSSHYPRPYVISLPDSSTNGAESSRKWGRQGLDLNAGPGPTGLEAACSSNMFWAGFICR
uniref:Mucin-19-like n=1 Tax=Nelumbo nucifera TaxID=4432 RepID=A0A822YTC3_NELNU|nr:TPA_asm: hypothetical protein HUJ06_005299 [Nelumbo nucifera]